MLETSDFILDAVYGVGFRGSAPDFMEPVFRAASESSGVTLALDVPSGVNCDTGAVEGPCVMADYTVSFSTLKNGHLLQPAKGCCGQVVVVPIGIDLSLINSQESPLEVTDRETALQALKPRNPESNKGDYGRLFCLCGSEGMAELRPFVCVPLCGEVRDWSTRFCRAPFTRLSLGRLPKRYIRFWIIPLPERSRRIPRDLWRKRCAKRTLWSSDAASAQTVNPQRCSVNA